MFWSKILEEMEKHGEVREFMEPHMVLDGRDGTCGLKVDVGDSTISVISHKYSYGGPMGLFEIMPGYTEASKDDVDGFLTEDKCIEAIGIVAKRLSNNG